MPKQRDRVKDGRSRLNLIIDDNLLEAIDGIAQIEGTSRSHIVYFLIADGLRKREYDPDLGKHPDFTKFWLECMAARPKGAFYEGPISYELKGLADNVEAKFEGYADELPDIADDEVCLQHNLDPNALERTRDKIQKIDSKYRKMFEQISEDIERDRREYERKQQILNRKFDPTVMKRIGK